MANLPDRPSDPSSNLPARRLSAPQVEAVLRRAVELQARESDARVAAAEGLSDFELIRIGEELGLSPRHIQQALVETSEGPPTDESWFGRGFGPSVVRASRLIRRDVTLASTELDAYLREKECMVVHRRFPEHVVYAQGAGVTATLQRAAAQVSGRHPLLNLKQLEVGIRPVDERSTMVSLSVDLRPQRTGLVAGGLVAGSGAGSAAAIFLAIAVAPPVAALGAPLIAGSLLGFRAIYRHSYQKTQAQLESLIDRLEHGELAPSNAPSWRQRLGL
jgi:hypothetical protein